MGQGLFCASFFSDYEKYSHHVNIFLNKCKGDGKNKRVFYTGRIALRCFLNRIMCLFGAGGMANAAVETKTDFIQDICIVNCKCKYLVFIFKKKGRIFSLFLFFGPLVLWSPGPLVLWSSGPLVLWSSGPLVPTGKKQQRKRGRVCELYIYINIHFHL